jgi:hypothetical protein
MHQLRGPSSNFKDSTAASNCRSHTSISLSLPASGAIRPLSANKPAVEGVRLATDLASSSSSSSSRDRDMRLF